MNKNYYYVEVKSPNSKEVSRRYKVTNLEEAEQRVNDEIFEGRKAQTRVTDREL